MTTKAGGLQVTRRHPLMGTEVRGVDLSQPLDDAAFEKLHALWMEHLLLIFPDQAITDEQHIAFGRRFGEQAEQAREFLEQQAEQ